MFIQKITWEGTSEVFKAELTSDLDRAAQGLVKF